MSKATKKKDFYAGGRLAKSGGKAASLAKIRQVTRKFD